LWEVINDYIGTKKYTFSILIFYVINIISFAIFMMFRWFTDKVDVNLVTLVTHACTSGAR